MKRFPGYNLLIGLALVAFILIGRWLVSFF